jgi:hypothetical protein
MPMTPSADNPRALLQAGYQRGAFSPDPVTAITNG